MSRHRAKPKTSHQRGDREKLELFLKLTAEMNTTDLAKKGLGYNYRAKWSKSEGFTQELQEPDENDLRSFLLTFRKFVSEESDVYLQVIHGVFYKRLTREDYRTELGKMNIQWRHLFQQGWLRLNINGREFPPEYTLKVYINGRYFHDDPDYAEELAQLAQHDPIGSLLHRSQFLAAVVETSKYIDWLACNLDYCLRQELLNFTD